MDQRKLRKQWMWLGGLGAALVGFGSCCVVECGFLKHSNAPTWQWVVGGTASLCVLLFGLILLIKAGFLGEALKKMKDRDA